MTQLHIRMRARDIDEENRASSPLELLFDLTFVVGISLLSEQLADRVAHGASPLAEVVPYLMVFFAIWWAWVNFTWFASAYDTDDVIYRLVTVIQMAGVLVLAAGVHSAFVGQNFVAVTIGYAIMRLAMVAQWVRATVENPETRAVTARYAIGIAVVQAGWLLRLVLPGQTELASFVVLALTELAVPAWAERRGLSSWHPHHIAERYGLFAIILLGEGILGVAVAMQGALAASGVSVRLVTVGVAGLILVVALWWLYFLHATGEGLEAHRRRVFAWGYGHYVLFFSLAAVAAGIELAVMAVTNGHGATVHPEIAAAALAVPTALAVLSVWVLNLWIGLGRVLPGWAVIVVVVLIALSPFAEPALGLVGTTVLDALLPAALVAVSIGTERRRAARA